MIPMAPFSRTTTSRRVAGDGDRDVGEAGADVRHRSLLDAEDPGQLLVVHRRPQGDERGAHEVCQAGISEQPLGDRNGEQQPRGETEGRRAHRVPERRAQHAQVRLAVVGVEPEAEERRLDARAEDDRQHDRQREQRLDVPVAGRRHLVGVEREQDDREDSRDEAAQAVDEGLAAEAAQLRSERPSGGGFDVGAERGLASPRQRAGRAPGRGSPPSLRSTRRGRA